MFRRTKVTMALLLLIMGMTVYGQEGDQSISLTLKDCIAKAMENNLGLAVAVLTPQIRDISVSQAKEKYLPSFSFSFNANEQTQASYSFLDAADVLNTSFDQFAFDLSQEIPGGGNFSLRLNNYRYDTNRTGTLINPSYRAELRFNYTQPLLKNFGKASKRDIIMAQTNLAISEKDLKRTLQTTLYNVEQAYWNLVFSIENLKVSQQSLKLAQDLLEKNRRGVEVGTLAPIEIITAEAQVAQREADILAAEAQVRNNEDRLKQVINLAADTENADFVQINPVFEVPSFEKIDISLEQALTTALLNRPDLESTRLGIQNSELDLSYAKNQQLPGLNLSASYWSPGVSGDQLIYDPENPWGPPIGSIPGGREDAFKDVFGFKYKNWAVGITLDVPLNTIISRAAYAQARVDLEQAKLQLKEQEQQIYTDLKIAVRTVETNFKRIQALRIARELAQKQLEAEEEKLKVGLTTNYFVLQYQRDLANARSQELQAAVDYILSVAALNRDMGISLDENNIQISGLWNK